MRYADCEKKLTKEERPAADPVDGAVVAVELVVDIEDDMDEQAWGGVRAKLFEALACVRNQGTRKCS